MVFSERAVKCNKKITVCLVNNIFFTYFALCFVAFAIKVAENDAFSNDMSPHSPRQHLLYNIIKRAK